MAKPFTGVYARHELWMRGFLRKSMAEALVSLTGNPNASMRWTVKGYYHKIYVEYGLELVGWPPDEVFADLSELTGSRRISMLFNLWKAKILTFQCVGLSKAERSARRPEDVAPSPRNAGVPPKLGRSDLKKRYGRKKVDPVRFPPRYVRNGPKSSKWVTAEAEARAARGDDGGHGQEDPLDPIESASDFDSA
ncbi:hypothetical protein C8Q73DRAFT_675122 [Cubamyces lactineus]|nr:hypothetical protein C8Q73DRAFT_713881 [Cubamyces lactineus]KAH9900662.1 hypothetical protein C8Q73DRAFT_675063 [Cubamyces lactineus]KAH9900664.1 hypothetical protein C8Q73DRAFT_675122 [Cubamyces lactineus]